ncbi:MEDS domain-containing protein [Streptomyces sp. NPDC050617]|uniref:MEDS domain-containing protein n=1 Tax=Streptomyces sp. NPDC050617 TaxID=3154628 RepID=UPI003430D605
MPADLGAADGFTHHACLYGSDDEFLAMAVPFAERGLAAGEPVLAATTAANIASLRAALGGRAYALDTAETAFFGRRPVERVSAFLRYHARRAVPGRRMRMIAEPVWGGKSAHQVAEWQRMEAGLNVLLAELPVWMICPYDTRAVPERVSAAARATHPGLMDGARLLPCPDYAAPGEYAAAVAPDLPSPPAGAPGVGPTADAPAVRRFARERAAAAGLSGSRLALAELAVHEAAGYLLATPGARVSARMWTEPGALACELLRHAPGSAPPPVFAGFHPPGAAPDAADGLWLARSLSEYMEVRGDGPWTRITLHIAGPRDAERL